MKQQSALQTPSTAPSAQARQRSVVMGQGIITPAVREHLAKSAKAARAVPKTPVGR